MARLASNSGVDNSPVLKSQVSLEIDSDIENMAHPFVSQANFATQLPYSSPKPLEAGSPQKAQLLGKRKVMGDLRQLINDNSRASKKIKPCADDESVGIVECNMQTEVERGYIMSVSINSALKSEPLTGGQDIGSKMSGQPRSLKQKAPIQDLHSGEDGNAEGQVLHAKGASSVISDGSVPLYGDRLDTLARWRDRLSKTKYLPRYLQVVSKAQNLLLAKDDSWQPALIGQPTRLGVLPLELLNSLTVAADQKAMRMSQPVSSHLRASDTLKTISQGETDTDKEPALLSNSPFQEMVGHTPHQSQDGAQVLESDSESSNVDWSPTPTPHLELPPNSSPYQAPPNMPVPSAPVGEESDTKTKIGDPVLTNSARRLTVDGVDPNQTSRHHSNAESGLTAHIVDRKTTDSLQGKPGSTFLNSGARMSTLTAQDGSLLASKSDFTDVEIASSLSAHTPIVNSSGDSTGHFAANVDNAMQVSHALYTAGPPTSGAPQPQSRQITTDFLKSSQGQPASQKMPPHSSPQLIPETFLREVVGSRTPGNLHDLQGSEKNTEDFEIDSFEDESVHDVNPMTSLSDNRDRDEQPAESQRDMLGLHSALQVTSITQGSSGSLEIGTTAQSTHAYSNIEAMPKDRLLTASDPNSPAKRHIDNLNHGELARDLKRAKSTTATSVVSVSSEEPDFTRIDEMARLYRRDVFSTLGKNETAPALPTAVVLQSNVSTRSESVQSRNRRHSIQTSILPPLASSTPLTSMSARAQNAWCMRPALASEMSEPSFLLPEDQFFVFKQTYPTYEGNAIQFLKSCRMIKKIRTAGKLLPQGVWDDFVYRHHHDYRSHLREMSLSDELESPLPYEEYYADYVSEPAHLKGVLRLAFIDALSTEEPVAALKAPGIRMPPQSDRPVNNGYSIAASSSASNIRQRASLADRPEKVITNNSPITLGSQLQLKEQEAIRQSQSSSVQLWLQKASGAASPELGTPDRLVAPGDVPHIDMTGNEDDPTFDLTRELLLLTSPSANICKNSLRVSAEHRGSPDAKAEPFKHFALRHATLGVREHGRSQIWADANGALRPAVQKIVDIFKWRGNDSCI